MTRDKQKKELVNLMKEYDSTRGDAFKKEDLAEYLLDNGVEVRERTTSEKCSAYKVEPYRRYLTEFERGSHFALTGKLVDYVDETRSVCWGTKETDECSCGGDPRKCDFYPEKRKKK